MEVKKYFYLFSLKALDTLPQIKEITGLLDIKVYRDEANNLDKAMKTAFGYLGSPQHWRMVGCKSGWEMVDGNEKEKACDASLG